MAALAGIYNTFEKTPAHDTVAMDIDDVTTTTTTTTTTNSNGASNGVGNQNSSSSNSSNNNNAIDAETAEKIGKKRTLDAKLIAEEYKIWKKNTPFLYDLVLTHALEWPSLTCEFLPTVQNNDGDCYKTHKLLFGTHTSTGNDNFLLVANVNLPKDETSLSTDAINSIEMGQGYDKVDAKITIEKYINHPGEVNLARHMPQDPNIVATKAISADILVFDLKEHPISKDGEKPKDKTVNPTTLCKGHTKDGYAMAWCPNKKGLLLSGADDKLICTWQVDETKNQNTATIYNGHTDVVEDVSWHNLDPNVFASVSDDKSLIIWDVRENNKQKAKTILRNVHDKEANAVDWSPFKEDLLLTAGSDHIVKLWDIRRLESSTPLHTFRGHDSEIFNLQWSPHMDTIFMSGSSDRRVYVWDLARIGAEQSAEDEEEGPAELLFIHGGHTDKVNDISWNLNDDWVIASVSEDNILQVWSMGENIYNPGFAIDSNAL
jgi:histone-binding protein RBBP4